MLYKVQESICFNCFTGRDVELFIIPIVFFEHWNNCFTWILLNFIWIGFSGGGPRWVRMSEIHLQTRRLRIYIQTTDLYSMWTRLLRATRGLLLHPLHRKTHPQRQVRVLQYVHNNVYCHHPAPPLSNSENKCVDRRIKHWYPSCIL